MTEHSPLDAALDGVAESMAAKGPRRLEVRHLWCGALLDVRAFSPGEPVTVGTESALRWSLLGRPVGWVSPDWQHVLRVSPPLASQVATTWRSDFVADDAAIPAGTSFACVRVEHGHHVAHLDPTWEALAWWAGRRVTLDELLQSGRAQRIDGLIRVPVDDELALAFQVGNITLVVLRAAQSHRLRPAPPSDRATLGMGAGVAALSALVALGMSTVRPDRNITVSAPDLGPTTVMIAQPVTPKPPPVARQPESPSSGAARGASGRVGDKRAQKPSTQGGGVDIQQAGLLAAWDAAAPTGTGLSASLRQGVGGLIGTVGTQFGNGGLGERGDGLGGGGDADALGSLPLGGHGGTGEAPSWERGPGGGISVTTEPLEQFGPVIDPHLIDEVIRRKLPQIRYCYQHQLQLTPGLAGSLSIAFTIAGDGSVSRAGVKRDGIGSAAVAACVVGKFQQMQFPRPNGGGLVMVTYPFTFAVE